MTKELTVAFHPLTVIVSKGGKGKPPAVLVTFHVLIQSTALFPFSSRFPAVSKSAFKQYQIGWNAIC